MKKKKKKKILSLDIQLTLNKKTLKEDGEANKNVIR